jgi:hypothetical protein
MIPLQTEMDRMLFVLKFYFHGNLLFLGNLISLEIFLFIQIVIADTSNNC